MNLDILLKIVNGKLINKGKTKKINKIKIDSRTVNKNDLFIALKGDKNDGHNYLKEVIKKNPSCIIVCVETKIKTNVPIILVEDTYDSLLKIGAFFRNKYNIPLIAITGSVGKTTTKELISEVLNNKYKILKSEKNYNNRIGIPLTLFNLNENYDICVIEMGMNHLNEISVLSKLCKPDIGVITNIGTSHIGNLGSQKNIFKAKMEIIDGMNEGLLIVNGTDKYLKKVKYPNLIKSGLNLKPYDIKISDKTSFKLKINNEVHEFVYNSPNKQLIINFLITIQIALLFKIDIEEIKQTFIKYQMPKDRMNIFYKNKTKIIADCYNASFESIKASLNSLINDKNEKIIILGDVLELGKHSYKIHKKIQKELQKIKNSQILLIGKEVNYINGKNYLHLNTNEEIINYLKQINLDNKTILIKGSRKMHLEQIVNYFKFDS